MDEVKDFVADPIYKCVKENEALRNLLYNYLMIITDLHKEGFKDPTTIAKTEVFMARGSCFNHSSDITGNLIRKLYDELQTFTKLDQKNMDACARDIWNYYREDLILAYRDDHQHEKFNEVIDRYIGFKESIDNVSPEVAKEIDDLVKMSDEEFQESLDKEEKEFDEEIDRQFNRKFDPEFDIPDETYQE